MARVEGFGKFLRGRIGDVVFYPSGEHVIARQVGEISKKRFRKDPAFEQYRKQQGVLSLASGISKQLRRSLRPYINYWKTSSTCSDQTGTFCKIIKLGRGANKEQDFEVAHLHLLHNSGLDEQKVILSTGAPFHIDREKGEIYFRMSYSRLRKMFGSSNPLPLRLVLGVVALSDMRFEDNYKPLHPNWHGASAFNNNKLISQWPSKGELRLKAKLNHAGPIPKGVGLIGVLGVYLG